MNIVKRLKNAIQALKGQTVEIDDKELLEWLGISTTNYKAVSEVTYYTCLKLLSETLGKMPLKYYQQTERGRIRADPTTAGILMSVRPNPYMTPTTMWTTVEQNCQHYGNGYIWIRGKFLPARYGGRYQIMDMWPMQSNYVTPIMDDVGIWGGEGKLYYRYSDPRTGRQYLFKDSEVMHFKTWYSLDIWKIISTVQKSKDVSGKTKDTQFRNH